MSTQLTFELRESGIQQAVDNAERTHVNWKERAFSFLKTYLRSNKVFMIEDVRNASVGVVPEPPSARAWGGIVLMAKRQGLIRHLRYSQTKNPLAHGTPASEWIANE